MRFRYSGTMEQKYKDVDGQRITHIEPLDESLFDRAEVGPMWYITLEGGSRIHAFDDEIDRGPTPVGGASTTAH